MQITIRYPAFLIAKQKGGRVARPTVILDEAEFTIMTLASEEAPLAVVVTTDVGGRREFKRQIRDCGGKLFGQLRPPSDNNGMAHPLTLDELVTAASSNPLSRNGLFVNVVEKVRSATFGPFEHGVQPSGIHRALYSSDVTDDNEIVAACTAMRAEIALEDFADELAVWRAAIQNELDRYACVDGAVYKHCGEPVYSHDYNIKVVYPETEGGLDKLSFAAHDLEGAEAENVRREALRPEGAYRCRDRPDHIEIVDELYITWRGEERDFDRYARNTERLLQTYISRLSDQQRDLAIPRAVFDSWLDLRDFLATYDARTETVPEEMEGILHRAIEEWNRYVPELPERVQSVSVVDPDTARVIFARFAERPIELLPSSRSAFRP